MTDRPVLFVTGLSGAGISTALKALEDCGYEVFDNFPVTHVEALLKERGYEGNPIAFGFDSRTRAFNPDRIIGMAREYGAKTVFLNATNASLLKRFSETRRTHPLAKDRTVTDGIIYEREWLDPLRANSDITIDTTDLSVHDLRRMIEADYSPDVQTKRLAVTVMSFGYKNGVPREVDMVLDVRFLKNPHWVPELKPLTGEDKKVQSYIESDEGFSEFYCKVKELVEFLLPRYTSEGKSYFTIAFGCTGGKHRSVFLSQKLAKDIEDMGYQTTIRHRDKPV